MSGLANVLLGVQVGLLVLDLDAQGAWVLPVAIGAFTLANVAGLAVAGVAAADVDGSPVRGNVARRTTGTLRQRLST